MSLLGASALADEPRRDLAPGSRAKGELAAGETHLYVASMVKGTAYSARLTGKKGFVPRLEILDTTRAPVDPGAALSTAGSKTLLSGWTVPATQVYLLRVSGGGAGSYVLATKGKPVRGLADTVSIDVPADTVTLEIDVATGATLKISAKRAKGSAAEPDILAVAGPEGSPLDLQRKKVSAKRASCRVTAPESGRHTVTLGTAGGTVGELTVRIKVKTLRLPRSRHKVRPGDEVPDFAFFAARVQPVFQARGCNSSACHGARTGQGRMILRGPATGSFNLEQTYWNYFQLAQWVTPGSNQSRAILKPLFIADGGMFHGGGDVFRKQDPEYRQFVDWVNGIALPSIPPVAEAGPDANGVVGVTLALDGTASFDLENEPVTYAWTLVNAPTGSAAALDDASKAKPLFTPDRSGAYLFELRVSDPSGGASAADQVVVSAEPSARADVITFEAEHAALTGDFAVAEDPAASGGEYVASPAGGAATGVATWKFTLEEAGEFALWGRALATSTGADALRVRIDGGPETTWEATPRGAWSFERANDRRNRREPLSGTFSLEAGPTSREVLLAADGTDTFAVVSTNVRLGTAGSLAATFRHTVDPTRRNAYLAFDLVDARNFLFAGFDADSGAVEVGRVVNGQIAVLRQVGTHTPLLGAPTGFRVSWDADGSVGIDVDGQAQQPYRFDPDDTAIRGGLTGISVKRAGGQDGAGRFDDVRVTDAGGTDLWTDDFESDGTWTDPLTLTIPPGAHELHVLADEGGVALDRLVLAPADLSPTDVVGEMRILRRLYFDTVNRSPTDDELLLAPFLGSDNLAGELTRGYAYAQAWYEAQLEKLGLVGRLEPLPTDGDFDTLSSIPARLANGDITELDALAEIALSEAWDRQNLTSKDAVYGVFEEFLGRPPITARPNGTGKSEYSAARRLQEGQVEELFGHRVSGANAFVYLVLGLDGKRPDYNHHVVEGDPGHGVNDVEALHREQILQAWRRVAGEAPPDASALAGWTSRYFADPAILRDLVTEMLRSSAYADATRTPRVKTDLQFVRGLFMDLLGERPDAHTVSLLHHAYAASGDEAPVNAQLVVQLLRSDAARPAAPPVDQIQIDAWVADAFVRLLGREPTPEERDGFRADLSNPAYADTAWALEALLTSDEYRTY